MMEVLIILLLVWIHFIADFILQDDYVAINKAKDNTVLVFHTMVYGLCFAWFGPLFMLITMVSHGMVDFVTSRGTSRLWSANQRHWFFCLIGFDQALHMTVLILTYQFTRGLS